jgi:hypothetical protein
MELPRHLRRLVGDLEAGTLKIAVEPTGLDELVQRAERLVLGIIMGTLIVGLAMLTSAYHPLGSTQVLGTALTVGTIVVVALGLLLTWSIVRSVPR